MSAFVLIKSGKHPDVYERETYPWGTVTKRCWMDGFHIKHETDGKVRFFDTEVAWTDQEVYSVERWFAKTAVRYWGMKPRPEEIPW